MYPLYTYPVIPNDPQAIPDATPQSSISPEKAIGKAGSKSDRGAYTQPKVKGVPDLYSCPGRIG